MATSEPASGLPKTKKGSVGSNCCIVTCHTTSAKCRGLSFIKLPRKGVSEAQDQWRAALIRVVDRKDPSFNVNTARICSRHFDASCIKYGPSGKCTGLVLGSMPIHWMHKDMTPKPSRPDPPKRPVPPVPQRVAYRDFAEVQKDLMNVKMPWIIMESVASSFSVGLPSDDGWKVAVALDRGKSENGMLADVKVFGIPAKHLSTDLELKKLAAFLKELQEMKLCEGVTEADLQDLAGPPDGRTTYYRDFRTRMVNEHLLQVSWIKSTTCHLLLPPEELQCKQCLHVQNVLRSKKAKLMSALSGPILINAKAPLHNLQKDKLKEAFKQVRQENKNLQKQLQTFKDRLQEESLRVEEKMHDSLKAVDTSQLTDPLQKLFWEEQQKAFNCKSRGMRWHPMIIRLAILLHSKSRATYDTLRRTGILRLPGATTLREYTSASHPQQGFTPTVMKELQREAEKLPEHQRYAVLLHDEMSIRSDLVFDQRSGELVGFVNKNTWTFEGGTEKLATHALVFFVVGLCCSLKKSLGYFGTTGATSDELLPLLWTAIGCLEECGWKVVASTSDKASPNQRLYQLHQVSATDDVCYKAVNLFAPEREVFFISDPPHLIKTVRNNLESSGSSRNTRRLWNNGHEMLWQHIADVYHNDMRIGLRKTKLTQEHIYLTPHSKMKVSLAAQVLSQRVGRVMEAYGPPEVQETAKFVLLMDRFFDCLNARHLTEGQHKLKPDLNPYRHADDDRFAFLEGEFLNYLEEFRTSVNNRPGNFTRSERQKMFLSNQTYRGLLMTVRAFVGLARFLLAHGVSFVLSNRLCQDPVEAHFARHRAIKRTAENPSLYEIGHQENIIRLQRQCAEVVNPSGNCRGAQQAHSVITISTSPLKKKRTEQK